MLFLLDFLLDALHSLCLAHFDWRRHGRAFLTCRLASRQALLVLLLIWLNYWQLADRGCPADFKVDLRISQFQGNFFDGFRRWVISHWSNGLLIFLLFGLAFIFDGLNSISDLIFWRLVLLQKFCDFFTDWASLFRTLKFNWRILSHNIALNLFVLGLAISDLMVRCFIFLFF